MLALMICVVVLDRRCDKNADTGLFELAYRQPPIVVPAYAGVSLLVEGRVMRKPATGDGGGTARRPSYESSSYVSRDGRHSVPNKVGCANVVDVPSPLGTPDPRVKSINLTVPLPAQNRTAQTRFLEKNTANSSVFKNRTRLRPDHAATTADSAVQIKQNDRVRATDGVKDRLNMTPPAQNRAFQTRSEKNVANSVFNHRTLVKLSLVTAADSAAVKNNQNTNGVKDRRSTDLQRSTTGVTLKRQTAAWKRPPRDVGGHYDSDSDAEPAGVQQSRSSNAKNAAAAGVKFPSASAAPKSCRTVESERSRSLLLHVPAGEPAAAAVLSAHLPTTNKTGEKLRKLTRPNAGSMSQRQRRSKPGRLPTRRRSSTTVDLDSGSVAVSDRHHRGLGRTPSTPPPSDMPLTTAAPTAATNAAATVSAATPSVGRAQGIRSVTLPTGAKTKPISSALYGVVFAPSATLGSPTRRDRRRRSLHDFAHGRSPTSPIKQSTSVNPNSSFGVAVSESTAGAAPRPPIDAGAAVARLRSGSLMRNEAASSMSAVRQAVAPSRRVFLPVDSWLRYSLDPDNLTPAAVQFTARPAATSRSVAVRDRDLSDLQASMRVIGLGTA